MQIAGKFNSGKAGRVLVVDNFDSFTFNLVQYLQELKLDVEIVRNNEKTVDEIVAGKPDLIVLSPGPSDPDHAGICLELVVRAAATGLPLLGVCLGHQSIGQALGGRIIRAPIPVHGKVGIIEHDQKGMFAGLPTPLKATRYHSLVIDPASLPPDLEISAKTPDGIIMAVRHRKAKIEGVQFHPESVLTEHGRAMLANFVNTL